MNQNVVFTENKEHLAKKGILYRTKEQIPFFKEHKEHFASPVILSFTVLEIGNSA